ncbi:hypothetical protein K438DRAFT_657654 [Mycena galopus ATCC 62051]|nr:hypothetical protein K438DRAFT_657654 [Mycena galopus ATCC 62051]
MQLMACTHTPSFFVMEEAYLLDVWQCYSAVVEHANSSQFELIVPPRLDRTSNDASIFTRASTGLPRTLSSGAASSPCCLIPSQTAANTEYTFSNDAGSPLDWPSYRVHRPPVPPRLDLAPATRSHGGRAFLGSPRSIPSTPHEPHAQASCAWCSAPSLPRRRRISPRCHTATHRRLRFSRLRRFVTKQHELTSISLQAPTTGSRMQTRRCPSRIDHNHLFDHILR